LNAISATELAAQCNALPAMARVSSNAIARYVTGRDIQTAFGASVATELASSPNGVRSAMVRAVAPSATSAEDEVGPGVPIAGEPDGQTNVANFLFIFFGAVALMAGLAGLLFGPWLAKQDDPTAAKRWMHDAKPPVDAFVVDEEDDDDIR